MDKFINSKIIFAGHDLIFVHVLPVTAISYFAFCWDHFQISYLVAHWLLPFLGSFAGWLFFYQQSQSSEGYVKTSVSSLARVQSKDFPCRIPTCDKSISQMKPFKSKSTKSTKSSKSAIPEPVFSRINATFQPIDKSVTDPGESGPVCNSQTHVPYPETCYCRFAQPEYCSCCCSSPATSYVCNFEDSWSGSYCRCPCDVGYCGPICNFHNNTQQDRISSAESSESSVQLAKSHQNSSFFTRLKVKIKEALGSIRDRLSVLYRSLTGQKTEHPESITSDCPSGNSLSSGGRGLVVLPASSKNYSKTRRRLKSVGRQNRGYCKYSN